LRAPLGADTSTLLSVSDTSIYGWIAHGKVIDRAMLVGGASIIGHLHDAFQQLCSGGLEFARRAFGSELRSNE